jgi:hypothetical protein
MWSKFTGYMVVEITEIMAHHSKEGRDSEIGWSFWSSSTACDPVDVPHEDHSWINQYLIMAYPFDSNSNL